MPSKYDPQYLRYLFQSSRSWTNLDFSKTKPNAFDENWTLSKNWEQTRLSIKNLDSKLTKRERERLQHIMENSYFGWLLQCNIQNNAKHSYLIKLLKTEFSYHILYNFCTILNLAVYQQQGI